MSILEIVLAIFISPLAVFLKKGVGKDLIINIILWILIPLLGGAVHAFLILSKK